MAGSVGDIKCWEETRDRLVLLLISQPRAGWESEFEEVTRREIERLVVPEYEGERDE